MKIVHKIKRAICWILYALCFDGELRREDVDAGMQLSDADTTEFRVIFDSVQSDLERLKSIMIRVMAVDAERALKFQQALQALAERLGRLFVGESE